MPNKTQVHLLILIVAHSGWLRDALQAVLRATFRDKQIIQTDDSLLALEMIDKCPPAFVLLDTSLPNEQVWPLLTQIKTEWPQTHCIVLADTVQQGQQADQAKADAVLIKGSETNLLPNIITKLLTETTPSISID